MAIGLWPLASPTARAAPAGADLFRDFAIGPGLTERDGQQRLPDAPLKFGALQVEFQLEVGQFARKIRVELVDNVAEKPWGLPTIRCA